jgi:hypothetical protein
LAKARQWWCPACFEWSEKSLCSGLQSLQATLQAAKKEMLTDRRGAAITSLQGVTAFINSIPLFESQSLSLPLTALMAELHDLNFGRHFRGLAVKGCGLCRGIPDSSWQRPRISEPVSAQ